MSQWKIISQKKFLKADLFDVEKIDFEAEKGKKKTHYIAERVPIVVVFPLTDLDEIYLVNEYRYLLKKIVLQAVAGHMDKKETSIAAARRELKEETGIIAHQLEEIARIEMSGSVFRSKSSLFLAKSLEMGENDLDEDEDIEVVKMPLSVAVEKIMTGEINHAATVIGILMLDKLKRDKKS